MRPDFTRLVLTLPLTLPLAFAAACGAEQPAAPSTSTSASIPERFHLAVAPEGALDAAQARSTAVDGEPLVVRGFVGGSREPFVSSLAAFTLVDPALDSCLKEDAGCETPWDYCCVDPESMSAGSVTVELHDGGTLLPLSARGFHGLDHMSQVVVEGVAKVDAQGNVTVVARGLHLP